METLLTKWKEKILNLRKHFPEKSKATTFFVNNFRKDISYKKNVAV